MANRYEPSTQGTGIGVAQHLVLVAISRGQHHGSELRHLLSQHMRGKAWLAMMTALANRDYVVRSRGDRYFLTNKGRAELPREQAPFERGVYVAPKTPPRRPGSDHSHLPSVAAGFSFPYRPHV